MTTSRKVSVAVLVAATISVVALSWFRGHESATAPVAVEPPTHAIAADGTGAPATRGVVQRQLPEPSRQPVAQQATCTVTGVLRTMEVPGAGDVEVSVALLVDGSLQQGVYKTIPARGRFSVAVPWQDNSGVQVQVVGVGTAKRNRVLPAIARDEVLDLGPVEVFGGAVVTGSVLDRGGRAVANLRLVVDAVDPATVDALGPTGVNRAILAVAASGAIEPGALRHGRWRVRLAGSGLRGVDPSEFDVRGTEVRVELVGLCAPTIDGVVLDRAGWAVPGVQLEAVSADDAKRVSMLPCVSDERGSFRLRAADAVDVAAPVLVQMIPGVDGRRFLVERAEPVAWGVTGQVVVVGESPIVDLLVLDADTGHPIEDYAVSCQSDATLVWRGAGPRLAGRVRVEPAGAGPWRLSVLPGGDDWPVV